MQMKESGSFFIRATFISELKNRFRCRVRLHDEEFTCYVPSSCKLSNFIDLSGCDVLLRPTSSNSGLQYSLYAAETKSGMVLLNLAEANRIIAGSINNRRFSFLGKRSKIRREALIDGYKCDLYIEDTDTIIEIKTIVSLQKAGHFPTVYSVHANKQLENIERLLDSGHRVCYLFVALCPKTKKLLLDCSESFNILFKCCVDKGMQYYGVGLKMYGCEFLVSSKLEVILSSSR